VYVGLTLLLFRATWAHPLTSVVGASTDPPATMWFLRWTPYALQHHTNPFLTHALNTGNIEDGATHVMRWGDVGKLVGS
jgi:hypothetical protein